MAPDLHIVHVFLCIRLLDPHKAQQTRAYAADNLAIHLQPGQGITAQALKTCSAACKDAQLSTQLSMHMLLR